MKDQIEKLFKEKYDDYVRMYKSRAGANDVEDLVQEAFYRALYYAERKPILISVENWFSGILENCLKDLYKEKRNGASMHRPLTEESAAYEIPLEGEGVEKFVVKEIAAKPVKTKTILFFFFIMGYKPSLISTILGISPNHVAVVTYQFKQELIEKYPEYAGA